MHADRIMNCLLNSPFLIIQNAILLNPTFLGLKITRSAGTRVFSRPHSPQWRKVLGTSVIVITVLINYVVVITIIIGVVIITIIVVNVINTDIIIIRLLLKVLVKKSIKC